MTTDPTTDGRRSESRPARATLRSILGLVVALAAIGAAGAATVMFVISARHPPGAVWSASDRWFFLGVGVFVPLGVALGVVALSAARSGRTRSDRVAVGLGLVAVTAPIWALFVLSALDVTVGRYLTV